MSKFKNKYNGSKDQTTKQHGKKDAAFFHVVVVDGRTTRWKVHWKSYVYNPNTNPATIDINFDASPLALAKGVTTNRHASCHPFIQSVSSEKHLMGKPKRSWSCQQMGFRKKKIKYPANGYASNWSYQSLQRKNESWVAVKDAKAAKMHSKTTPAAEATQRHLPPKKTTLNIGFDNFKTVPQGRFFCLFAAMYILRADSGSTKTDRVLFHHGKTNPKHRLALIPTSIARNKSATNPHQSAPHIEPYPSQITAVHYYGAGVPPARELVHQSIAGILPHALISV